jgi:hypothetical protein
MGLLEAWAQLQLTNENVLLVCYDEEWPQYLAPPIGQLAFACALVLSTNPSKARAMITKPKTEVVECAFDPAWTTLAAAAPAAAAIPLLRALQQTPGNIQVPLNSQKAIWFSHCEIFKHD